MVWTRHQPCSWRAVDSL